MNPRRGKLPRMELFYPVSSGSPTAGSSAGSVTVLVNRTVPAAEEQSFVATLSELLAEFDCFPGTSGSLVLRRESDGGVDFSIVQRFEAAKDHDAWLASPGFARWKERVAPPVPTSDHVHRYSGMDAFFVSAKAPAAPPRWKMAVVLFVAVYPMSLAMSAWAAPVLARVSPLAGALITSVVMVIAMTYIVVPLLTKLFERWLQAKASSSSP